MAPPRIDGLRASRLSRSFLQQPQPFLPVQAQRRSQPSQQRRLFADLTPKLQIYRSTTTDPYINLSAEHYLLQRSHPDSTILFLYTNTPCVVIGRNQNPWLEVNLRLLRRGVPRTHGRHPNSTTSANADTGLSVQRNRPVALVRRRSGGGTVFHDEGNVNWSVICPSSAFSRTAHAEMVVRALTALGVPGARVNGRHDIVQDVPLRGSRSGREQQQDPGGGDGGGTFKVSGSAYKLTRVRSLHHGTCLLSSRNLDRISPLLRSPAETYVKARGVESVRSPVRNVGLENREFENAVIGEFRKMYGLAHVDGESPVSVHSIGEEVLETAEIEKGFRELTSPEWIFGQTPQFTFSTHPTPDDPRPRLDPPKDVDPSFRASLTVRHGQIQEAAITGLTYQEDVDQVSQDRAVSQGLVGQHLYEISDWGKTLWQASPVPLNAAGPGAWLNEIFASRIP